MQRFLTEYPVKCRVYFNSWNRFDVPHNTYFVESDCNNLTAHINQLRNKIKNFDDRVKDTGDFCTYSDDKREIRFAWGHTPTHDVLNIEHLIKITPSYLIHIENPIQLYFPKLQ